MRKSLRDSRGDGLLANDLIMVFQEKSGGRMGREWKKDLAKGREIELAVKMKWEMMLGW